MKRVIKASLKTSNTQHTQQSYRDSFKCTFTIREFLDIAKAIRTGKGFECTFVSTLDDFGEIIIGRTPALFGENSNENNRH